MPASACARRARRPGCRAAIPSRDRPDLSGGPRASTLSRLSLDATDDGTQAIDAPA